MRPSSQNLQDAMRDTAGDSWRSGIEVFQTNLHKNKTTFYVHRYTPPSCGITLSGLGNVCGSIPPHGDSGRPVVVPGEYGVRSDETENVPFRNSGLKQQKLLQVRKAQKSLQTCFHVKMLDACKLLPVFSLNRQTSASHLEMKLGAPPASADPIVQAEASVGPTKHQSWWEPWMLRFPRLPHCFSDYFGYKTPVTIKRWEFEAAAEAARHSGCHGDRGLSVRGCSNDNSLTTERLPWLQLSTTHISRLFFQFGGL